MEDSLRFGLQKLGYEKFRKGQRRVIEAYLSGKDVMFCAPTGSGKSLCFEVAPFVFNAFLYGAEEARQRTSSVCLVVAPLVSLMENQVTSLRSRAVSVAMLGPECRVEIRRGEVNVVFGSPEALLGSHRSVMRDLKYVLKAVFIDESHCIAKW